jgi:excisionase family DNA binding protein
MPDTLANPNELLNREQTAELIGVAASTLDQWRCYRRHGLPFIRVGRLIRYKRSQIEAWLKSRTDDGGQQS